jgi:DNA-binding NtrC family response regulator
MDTVYIIDDEEALCLTLKRVLESVGYKVLWTTNPQKLLPQLPNNKFSCILLDLKLGDDNLSGIDYLKKIHEFDPHLPVIMITAFETVKTAVEAMKLGSFHYLRKPFDNDELKALIAKAVEMRKLYWEVSYFKHKEETTDLEILMGHSDVVQNLKKLSLMVAKTDINVLLTGESGSGKELLAQSIHRQSARKDKSIVVVDCASIPESLIESELWGHEKGAFTGAYNFQRGKLEEANEGTLFLDEIANIPFNVQAKLLRFLETRTFERLGGRNSITINTRIITATNRELPQLIKEGSFRDDLFYRLNEFPIHLPPLRERIEDIPYLSLKFIREFQNQVGKTVSDISDEAIKHLQFYHWPGNGRELRNIIKRAMVLCHEKIEKKDLAFEIIQSSTSQTNPEIKIAINPNLPLQEATKEITSTVEKKMIEDALRRSAGRKGKTAELLGIDEKTLYNKLKEYKIVL